MNRGPSYQEASAVCTRLRVTYGQEWVTDFTHAIKTSMGGQWTEEVYLAVIRAGNRILAGELLPIRLALFPEEREGVSE